MENHELNKPYLAEPKSVSNESRMSSGILGEFEQIEIKVLKNLRKPERESYRSPEKF